MTALAALLAFVPRRVLWVLLVLAAVMLVTDEARLAAARMQTARAIATLQAERAAAAQAAAALQAEYSQTEQLRATRAQEIQRDHDHRLASLRDDAARAADAARRLRAQLAQIASSGHQGPTGSGVAHLRAPAGDLAELLGACSERYRAVAAAADEHRAAGVACERSFDAVRGQ